DGRAYAAAHQDWAAFEAAVETPPGLPDSAPASLYRRSLDALRALTDRESGAVIAGARPGWAYCWPRDAVFAAVAYDLAGRHREAARVYDFLARAAPRGDWAARYWADGTPVTDGRPAQLDAPGLFLWGVWLH